ANAAENQTVAIDVDATDDSDTEGNGLTYSITDGDDAALFSIDADTGEVTFDAAPDFENPGDAGTDNVYDLQVTVTDSSGLTDVQDIAITITDVDENSAPTITSAATANAAENQTVAIDVEATDDTDTEGNGLTYSITDGDDAALFSIDADTGEITFDAAPDFENPGDAGGDNVYDLQVTVTDSSGLTDVQDIAITVTDVDENSAPTITSAATANAAENQTVAIDVDATDDSDTEGNGLTYSITDGDDAALFSIDADTGEVTFDAAPDFENPGDAGTDNVYDLQVTVTDSSGLTDVQDIAITITDVDENSAPTITSAATANAAENQTVAIDVEATDDTDTEGNGLTYSITDGDDAALFSIDADTGEITFDAAPDFENPGDAGGDNVYDLQVTVTDSSGLTDVQDIAITVTDVDENSAPTITSAATANAAENQTVAIDVEATDDTDTEGNGLTYSITDGDDAALFSIDADTGEVTFDAAPDFENPGDAGGDNVYDLQVTVTDSSGLTDVQDIAITVTDVDENNAPTITSTATANAAENQTVAIDVEATDDTDTEGNGLTYSITDGDDATLFSIDADTGEVTFDAAPDFENPGDAGGDNVYDLQVTVTDSSGLTDVQDIAITVTDVDETSSNGFLFSVNNNTRVDGVTYTEQDILQFDGTEFSLFFDGSNVLPGGFQINAFDVISDTEILFSFAQPFSLENGEVIDDSDIVKFTATNLGSNTAGSFSLYFDGSDVGLDSRGERIDALVGLPVGSLLLSTTGNANVSGVSARDEDVLLFSPNSLGSDTSGSFSVFFDGSDVGLGDAREDVDAFSIDAAGDLFFSNTRNFSVSGLSGQDEDVFAYTPSSTGSVTTGTFASELFFDGSQDGGFSTDIKGIDLTFTQI
ncbi:MAG: cadherin repeat domain-containing protein, partial [Leptolyngbya sp. SIO3F4]|nr:cadherin repeat domain-containing protein [Leptolyngbya sp. SIO3F4]